MRTREYRDNIDMSGDEYGEVTIQIVWDTLNLGGLLVKGVYQPDSWYWQPDTHTIESFNVFTMGQEEPILEWKNCYNIDEESGYPTCVLDSPMSFKYYKLMNQYCLDWVSEMEVRIYPDNVI